MTKPTAFTNTPQRPKRGIDPIIFKYEPQGYTSYIERMLALSEGEITPYIKQQMDHWAYSVAIAKRFVTLANLWYPGEDEAQHQGYYAGIAAQIAKEEGSTRQKVYLHLEKVIY